MNKKTKNKYIIPSTDLWYITYGGYTKKDSHSYDVYGQRWAYDFDCNIDGSYYHDDGNINDNYFGYNKPILAPIDGFIVDLVDGIPDSKAYADMRVSQDSNDVRGNYLVIKANYGEYCTICHIKRDSFKVKIGDLVKQGEEIARVGNSGRTKGAHIHMQVNRGMDFFNSEPLIIVFNNILVNNKNKTLIKVGDFVRYLMDEYSLKEYVLKDIENYIRDFIKTNPITDFNYLEEANIINETLSNKEKLQDALLVLNRMNGPMDLIFLIKNKLKKNKGDLK